MDDVRVAPMLGNFQVKEMACSKAAHSSHAQVSLGWFPTCTYDAAVCVGMPNDMTPFVLPPE